MMILTKYSIAGEVVQSSPSDLEKEIQSVVASIFTILSDRLTVSCSFNPQSDSLNKSNSEGISEKGDSFDDRIKRSLEDENSDSQTTTTYNSPNRTGVNVVVIVVISSILVSAISLTVILYCCMRKKLKLMAEQEKLDAEDKKLGGFLTRTQDVDPTTNDVKYEQTDCCICLQAFEPEEPLRKINV